MDIREDDEMQTEGAPSVDPIATSLNAQLGDEPAPTDWSLWLLPVVALMLLVGAVAIYFLPTNFDMVAPLCYWLLLATALLVVVALRTIPVLASPLNDAVHHRPDGERISWNRFASLSSLLIASILVTGLAAGGMLIFVLGTPQSYAVYREFDQPFALAGTAAVVVILLLFVWLVRIGPHQKLLQLRFAGAGVLVIPVVVYLALNAWSPSMADDRSTYTGPVASWPYMLQFARHEADRIDKDAILYDVYLYISYGTNGPVNPHNSLFSVDFMYVRPTGEGITIGFVDTNPIRLEAVSKEERAFIRSYEYARDKSADWLPYLKLGPREVYSLTEKEAIEFAQRRGIDVTKFGPRLHVSQVFNYSQFGVPAVWDIDYVSDIGLESLALLVDSSTGKVLDRRPYPEETTATPAPQPAATASPTP